MAKAGIVVNSFIATSTWRAVAGAGLGPRRVGLRLGVPRSVLDVCKLVPAGVMEMIQMPS